MDSSPAEPQWKPCIYGLILLRNTHHLATSNTCTHTCIHTSWSSRYINEGWWGRKWGGSHEGGRGWSGLWGARVEGWTAFEAQTWPSPGTLLPGTQRRSDFRSLAHASSELAHKVAGGGSATLALPLPFPPGSPAPFRPLLRSLPPSLPKSRVRSPLCC